MAYWNVEGNKNHLLLLANLPYNRKDKGRKIQTIFRQYWSDFLKTLKTPLRSSIIYNVENMMNCHILTEGYIFYEFPKCDNFTLTGLSCHSRFCTSCNKKYSEHRSLAVKEKLLDVPHRHFVFTIPDTIRNFFRLYRDLYDILFQSVNESLKKLVQSTKSSRRNNKELGIVCFLHTYGRSLALNPHIHALISEATVDNNKKVKNHYFFPFNRLKKIYMYTLLNNIYDYLKEKGRPNHRIAFYKLREQITKEQKDEGLYIYGPKNKTNKDESDEMTSDEVTEYIVRYSAHPAISEQRILDIDYENNTVYWYYDPHEDDGVSDEELKLGRQYIKDNIFDFIKRLIIHIPDKGFHLIRYYGAYSNRSKKRVKSKNYQKVIQEIKQKLSNLSWRLLLLKTYGYDPILCKCGTVMVKNIEFSYLKARGDPRYEQIQYH
jgi:hypothetical protein